MQNALEIIRSAGLKVTPRRIAIIALFSGGARPLSPLQVQMELKKQFVRCGLPGVYRNLEALAECGILCRLAGFGRERSYALCGSYGNRHMHRICCVACGRIEAFDDGAYHDGMMVGGYRLLSHTTHSEGICASCLSETNGEHPT